ncbi:hypothetical protein Glove_510g4 [Diversispora epigaea]|uniref:Uncharacterized protein n=1 Tax=Diversispora epigaea TaxID=1348612 RepID=A0A397GLB1_9GLOM|nr:hypothetical protein Glove_510g4 [Diversispora epigaea]
MIYTTTILWDMLDYNNRKILEHFVWACNLLVARFVTEDDLQEAQKRLRDMSVNIERTYGSEFIISSYPNSNRQIKPELMRIVLKNLLKAAGSLAVTNEFDREELQHNTSNKIYGIEYIPGHMLTPLYEKKKERCERMYGTKWKAYRDRTNDIYPGEYKNVSSSSIQFKHKFMEFEVSNTEL